MELGWARPKRLDFLSALNESSTDGQEKIEFQGRVLDLPAYRVPLDLPKYRLANGRTQAYQEEYLASDPDVDKELFTRDLESAEAHEVQHGLLKKDIDEENLGAFFRKNIQIEALYLSNDGFVINGNRRLCAMRELFAEDPSEFSRFQTVRIIRLPVADEVDIDELEARLQVITDIKAEYNWVSEAIMLRKRRPIYKIKKLCELYQMNVSSIDEIIDMLRYAEEYLHRIEKPKMYSVVFKDEFAFRQLIRTRKKMKDETDKAILEKSAYAIIENPKQGRAYAQIKKVGAHIEAIKSSLDRELGSKIANEVVEKSEDEELLGEIESEQSNIIEVMDDRDKQNEIVEIISEEIHSQESLQREMYEQDFVLNKVRAANTSLIEALSGISNDLVTKDGIAEQLESINDNVSKLKTWATPDD